MPQPSNFLKIIGQKPGEESRNLKYDPAFCETIRMLAQNGEFPEAWAAEIGITLETMRLWCLKYPDFYEAVGVARILLATYWTRKIKAEANNPNAKPGMYLMLARRFPALYGRNPVDLGEWMQSPPEATDGGKALDANTVAAASTEDLRERLEALKRRREEEERG